MKLSTRFYRMRRKNRKGLLAIGVLFALVVLIIGGGTAYLLTPADPQLNATSSGTTQKVIVSSSQKAQIKSVTKSTIKPSRKSSSKSTTKHSGKSTVKSTTKPSSNNSGNSTTISSSTPSDTDGNELPADSNTSATEGTSTATTSQAPTSDSTTPTTYTATVRGFTATSSVSYEEAQAIATSQYNAAVAQKEQLATSIAKSYEAAGYQTNIIHEGEGGN